MIVQVARRPGFRCLFRVHPSKKRGYKLNRPAARCGTRLSRTRLSDARSEQLARPVDRELDDRVGGVVAHALHDVARRVRDLVEYGKVEDAPDSPLTDLLASTR